MSEQKGKGLAVINMLVWAHTWGNRHRGATGHLSSWPMVGVGLTRGQQFGCILHHSGFRYKRAGIMAAVSNHDAGADCRTVSIFARRRPLIGGYDRKDEAILHAFNITLDGWA